MVEIDHDLQNTEYYLQLALHEGNRTLEMAIIRQLAQRRNHHATNLLTNYIGGTFSDRLPTLYHCRIAAEILVHFGESGQQCLCAVLSILSRNPRNARWTKLIVECLHSQSVTIDVRKSIRRWKWSPAGWPYMFRSFRRLKQRGNRI